MADETSRVGGEALRQWHNAVLELIARHFPHIPTSEHGDDSRATLKAFAEGVAALREQASDPTPALTDYEKNILESVANWLLTRSATVWAKNFGYSRLMAEWAKDIANIRSRLASPQAGASDPTPAPSLVLPEPPDMMHFFEPDFEGGSALDTAMANWARSLTQKTQKVLDDVVQDLMRRYGKLVWDEACNALAPPQAARAPLSPSTSEPKP